MRRKRVVCVVRASLMIIVSDLPLEEQRFNHRPSWEGDFSGLQLLPTILRLFVCAWRRPRIG